MAQPQQRCFQNPALKIIENPRFLAGKRNSFPVSQGNESRTWEYVKRSGKKRLVYPVSVFVTLHFHDEYTRVPQESANSFQTNGNLMSPASSCIISPPICPEILGFHTLRRALIVWVVVILFRHDLNDRTIHRWDPWGHISTSLNHQSPPPNLFLNESQFGGVPQIAATKEART